MSGEITERPIRSRVKAGLSFAAMTLTAATFVGVAAGGIALLHMRADAEATAIPNPPITVAVRKVLFSSGYTVNERFAGRLEPARQTRLAFERGGLVTSVDVEEGDRLSQKAVVARLDTSKLESERSRLEAQQREIVARMELAKATLKRQVALTRRGWQSEQRHDAARFAVAELSAAIERLNSSIRTIEIDIEKSALKLPFTGTIAARFVDEGAVVTAGTPVVEIMETERRQVRVGVSVEAARDLESDHHYQLSSGGKVFRGRLISKRPDLQTGTRTVTVLLETSQAEDVPFGEIVELNLDRRIEAQGFWLPVAALSEGRKGLWTVLTVVREDGEEIVAREAVEVLHVDDRRVFARGTLGDGARIVLNGTNRVIPGQHVAVATN